MHGATGLPHCTAPNLFGKIAALRQRSKEIRAALGLARHYNGYLSSVELDDDRV